MSFLHRFGSALNPNIHFHCCVLDAVFDAKPTSAPDVQFWESIGLPAQEAAVRAPIPRRALRWFLWRGWFAGKDRQMTGRTR